MNRSVSLVITSSILLVSLTNCRNIAEQQFFNFDLVPVSDSCPSTDLDVDFSENYNAGTSDCLIKDSLIISPTRSEYLFSISDMESGDIIGSFCHRGRAGNEPLSALPLFHTYKTSDGLCADIFSFMDSKLFSWNISQSIKQRKDVYNEIIKIDNTSGPTIAWMSFYRLDGNKVIAYNSMQDAIDPNVVAAPKYEIYDLQNGKKVKEFNLFNAVDKDTDSEWFSSKMFLTNVDCINDERTKLFVGMSYMPVYCLIDINTGEARGFKLEGLNSFSTKEERWHFVDVCADDRYVYALYSGEILFNPDGTYIPDTLYVFGWNGDVKLKCKLNHRFSELNIDNGYLYLRNSDGDMASIKTEQFLQLLQ